VIQIRRLYLYCDQLYCQYTYMTQETVYLVTGRLQETYGH
jgi:hypothetical protein